MDFVIKYCQSINSTTGLYLYVLNVAFWTYVFVPVYQTGPGHPSLLMGLLKHAPDLNNNHVDDKIIQRSHSFPSHGFSGCSDSMLTQILSCNQIPVTIHVKSYKGETYYVFPENIAVRIDV